MNTGAAMDMKRRKISAASLRKLHHHREEHERIITEIREHEGLEVLEFSQADVDYAVSQIWTRAANIARSHAFICVKAKCNCANAIAEDLEDAAVKDKQ